MCQKLKKAVILLFLGSLFLLGVTFFSDHRTSNSDIVKISLFQAANSYKAIDSEKEDDLVEITNGIVKNKKENLKIIIENAEHNQNLIILIDEQIIQNTNNFDKLVFGYTNEEHSIPWLNKGKHTIKVIQLKDKNQKAVAGNIVRIQRKDYLVK